MYKLINIKNNRECKIIATSSSLLKLFKIEFMSTYESGLALGNTYIIDDGGNNYGVVDLNSSDYWNFRHFEEKVSEGARFKSYNYLNRFLTKKEKAQ